MHSNVDGSDVTLTNVEMLVFADKEDAILLPVTGVTWTDGTGIDDRLSFPDSTLDSIDRSTLLADDPVYGRDLINNDTLTANAGNDIINAGPGNDSMAGGSGNDPLYGSYGDDTIDGGNGNDSLHGDTGNDSLVGWNNSDSIEGGLGNDTVYGDGFHTFPGGGEFGPSTVYANVPGDDTIIDFLGHNELNGDAGNDLIQGNGTLHGGAGNDNIYGEHGKLYGDAGNDAVSSGDGHYDVLLVGGDGNDTLYGNATLGAAPPIRPVSTAIPPTRTMRPAAMTSSTPRSIPPMAGPATTR